MGVTARRRIVIVLAALLSVASHTAGAQPNAPAYTISGLEDRDGNPVVLAGKVSSAGPIGLDGDLAVVLSGSDPIDASNYVLFLDGHPIKGLEGAYFDAKLHALVFPLVRNDQNKDVWASLLGYPSGLTKPMTVALGKRPTGEGAPSPDIVGADGKRPSFTFTVLSPFRLFFAFAFILLSLGLVWGSARKTGIMRDNYIPQIESSRQTYSLGRWQMAVWFSLVLVSYVFLYILLGDINTLSPQALMLMGISSATALAAVTVDKLKDTPADATNQALKLLGIKDYSDVQRLRAEIADRQKQLAVPGASAQSIALLNSQIIDRQNKLQAYEEQIAPFLTEGWWNDIATDDNGPALHRVQVVCWTLLLGFIFLAGVYGNLAMPEFSSTLLALMGISSGGYIGFKYPEAGQ